MLTTLRLERRVGLEARPSLFSLDTGQKFLAEFYFCGVDPGCNKEYEQGEQWGGVAGQGLCRPNCDAKGTSFSEVKAIHST